MRLTKEQQKEILKKSGLKINDIVKLKGLNKIMIITGFDIISRDILEDSISKVTAECMFELSNGSIEYHNFDIELLGN